MALLLQRSKLSLLGSLGTWRPASIERTAARPNLTFAMIEDLNAFEALRREWVALFEAAGRPHQVFQRFEWLAIWARFYVDRRTRLAVVTARRDGRLVLVWPLVVRSGRGLRILTGMGEPVSQYSDALLAPDLGEAGEDAAVAFAMSRSVDVVSLRRVRDDAAVAPMLGRRLGASINRQAAPFVDLAGLGDAKAFEARFSGKLRSSRRRRRRRLDERGSVTFTPVARSPEAVAHVATALSFKRDWARRAGVVAPALRDPRFEQVFLAAAQAGADAPDLRVSVMRCGDETIGIELSAACKGHLFGHVLAPRPDFEMPGLGGLLAEATILGALTQGFATIDLLAPADSYKLEWTDTCVGVGDYAVPRSWRGLLYVRIWLRFGRDAAKAAAKKLRPLLAKITRRRV